MAEAVDASTEIGVADARGSAKHRTLSYHAIAKRDMHAPELLHVTLEAGDEALPLFTHGESARTFLASRGLADAWYARECCAGEMVSLLLGLYAGIDGVLLDPDDEAFEACAPEGFVRWGDFVSYLLGDGPGTPDRIVPHGLTFAGTT